MVVGFLIYNFTPIGGFFKPNYAKELAKPIEEALVDAGARKVCESGDKGLGIDNREPWYRGYFETNLTKDEATKLISKTAKADGHNLIQATSDNHGYVNVSDDSFSEWLFADQESKSRFKDLEEGQIKLLIHLENSGSYEINSIVCHTSENITVSSSEERTSVRIDISLPSYKISH